jgi:hypothetical protein
MPSRTLTNDDDAIPGEDTSEVSNTTWERKRELATNDMYPAGHQALRRAIAGMEARRRLSPRLYCRHGEDEPCPRQGV